VDPHSPEGVTQSGRRTLEKCHFTADFHLGAKSEVAPQEKPSSISKMTENITIDGRGMSIHDAINEMWARMQPLTQRGFNPVSGVEIVDNETKQIIESFQIDDPEFLLHLNSDETQKKQSTKLTGNPHAPERKEHFRYVARIELVS